MFTYSENDGDPNGGQCRNLNSNATMAVNLAMSNNNLLGYRDYFA
jgi:hypothetical protein